ncbi:PPP4R2-domain-containing protein [Boletus edulis BED1]|uniref:PPP4R2-domain-containing protein n=1 Tax=Boletus edulis BED1 TaxID=1328754 RepID=A0AAD4C4R4_BOLED|nr:PPP4R2-domain-containing protein [Boletus edulis BED1]
MATTAECPHNLSGSFEWRPEYQLILEHIASTDTLDPNTEWQLLREMIKYRINENIALFLADATQPTEPSKPATGTVDSSGNLRLPPFPPRQPNEMNPHEVPKARLNQDEANEMKNFIFRQLHDFEDNPPFTIQRVCELCVYPKQHYKFIGKYLRAVEKSLLVTSTWDAFPIELSQNGFSIGTFPVDPSQSAPATPMFSPIPFLHDDARRSKSQSPPPSPLALAAMKMGGGMQSLDEPISQRAIGLVDELDDPSPGHMSDHPTAITSVTTIGSRPFLETLETRFVRGSGAQSGGDEEQKMAIDE